MPKTIFAKLLIGFGTILGISMIISLVMVSVFFLNFISNEKMVLLEQNSEKINRLLNFYYSNESNTLLSAMMENLIENYSENTEAIIWVSNREGEIVFISKNTFPKVAYLRLLQENNTLKMTDKRQYSNFDQDKIYEQTGDFYGLFQGTGVSWLTVVRPSYRMNGDKMALAGAVYIAAPLPELQSAYRSLIKYYLFAISISGMITVILIYYLARRMSRPLLLLRDAAKRISGGKLENRILIKDQGEISELAESFNEMANELGKLDEIRKTFVANVSHELRTPMTSIGGFVEGMLDGTIPESSYREYLGIVSGEIRRLNRLANDLLELARMDSGAEILSFERFGMNELIRLCIIKMESGFNAKSINVEVNLEEDEIYVKGDKDSIERVLINLIHNAIKFSNPGGIIRLDALTQENKVYVSVEDSGIGISKSDLERIWDRFYKIDKSRTTVDGGAGLGLSIVKSIIERHDETIVVESEEGKGTKFTFSLKIVKPTSEDAKISKK